MIVVRLMGGLGNQMFQYAAGRALQKRRGDELRLDITYLLGPAVFQWDVPREYDLDVFRIEPLFAYDPELVDRVPAELLAYPGERVLREGIRVPKAQTRFLDEPFGFHPQVLDLTESDVYLDGYWQSESYFAEIQGEIREAFQFRVPLSEGGRRLAEEIASVNAVCVNVRRGDFVTVESTRNALGFVGEDYYRRAEEWIKERIPNPHLYISSDDYPWCRQNLRFEPPVTYLEPYTGWKFGEKLQLMIRCKHFVIPNSTFAWWAAWLGNREGKLVACPRKWFRSESLSAKDLIPPAWEAI